MKLHFDPAVPFALLCTLLLHLSSRGADEDSSVPDGPWISAVDWLDNEHVVGTRSQGLLYRTAEVVKAASSDPAVFEVLGESETSLWAVLALDGGKVVASDYKGGVHLFGDGQPKQFELDARWIRALSKSPNAAELLAATEDGKLIVLSMEDLKEARRVDAHDSEIFDIAVSSAGDKIATASYDGSIKIFSWPKLEPLGEMSVGKDAIWSLVFVGNDRRLVSGGADRRIQLWDVASGKSIVTMAMAHNWVTSLVALPESDLVAAGCMDGSVMIVDYHTMLPVTSQAGPGTAIWSLALSPDGRRIAVGTRKHGLAIMEIGDWIEAGRAAAEKSAAIRPPAPSK